MQAFTLNGKTYTTDSETVAVLRSIIGSARASGDSSAVQALLALGITTGRIQPAPWYLRAEQLPTPVSMLAR